MIDPESLYRLQFASDPQIAADSRTVAYVLTRIATDEPTADDEQPVPEYRSAIWVARDSHPAAPLTAGMAKDSAPRFSPDGRQLAFLSTRGATGPEPHRAHLYLLPLEGGEARQLTQLKSGANVPKWSADGRWIAFISRGDHDARASRGEPRVIERMRYKANGLRGAGLRSEMPWQLWVVEVATGETRQVVEHPWDVEDFDWLPDSSGLVFLAARDEAHSAAWHADAFLARLAGGPPTRLTDWDGLMVLPAVSPDGTRVAVVANPHYVTQPGDRHLYVFELAEAQQAALHRLDAAFDQHAMDYVNADCHYGTYPMGPVWQSDGSLLMIYTLGGSGAICRATLPGEVRPLIHEPGANIAAFDATPDGRIVLLRETNWALCDLHVWEGGATRPVSTISDAALRGLELSPGMEHVRLERDGFTVEGWLLKPVGWRADGSYPVVLSIHGGPATAYGHTFFHEFQVFAANGYAVLFGNIRGSVGYGEAQTAGTQGRYGAGDYEDLLALLDVALERFVWLDRARQAVVGGSYGGIMTNWIISHTDRFRAAVTDRCICNWVSFAGTSDIGYYFTPRELRGNVPEDWERLWELSPLKHVANVRTPTLIIHSEEDHRTPIEQGEQWFVALQRLHVPSRFVRFPGENHDLSRHGRPDRRVVRLREYLGWLQKYLRAEE